MNYARKVLNIDRIHSSGITGKNVTMAVLDTGIHAHLDLMGRITKFYDLVNDRKKIYDDNGHGTHISGIFAGDGKSSKGKFKGMCPDAKLVIIKVLDKYGKGREEDVVKAAEWIIRNKNRYNINIVNISFGTVADDKKSITMVRAIEKLWEEGLVVVAAAGNNGPKLKTITTPGICEKIITVGALHDERKVYVDGKYVNEYSGVGCWENGMMKPEVIAPATMIYSCKNAYKGYTAKSGTSMATPIVSGAIGLLLEQNPGIKNYEIKDIIRKTSVDCNMSINRQGYGLICPEKMLGLQKLFNEV